MEITGDTIAIGGQILGLFTIIIVFAFVAYAVKIEYKKRELQSREILAAIEKGATIPFTPVKERNYRNQGIVWLAIGISMMICIYVASGVWAGAIWGLIPAAVGIALLLIYHYGSKRNEEN